MLHENSIDPQAELQSAVSPNSTTPAQTPNEQLKTPCAAIRSQQWGNIPAELRELDQWCLAGNDKRPLKPDGSNASPTDPNTWCSFDDACEATKAKGCYIGFVLKAGNGLTCIDLDIKDSESRDKEGKSYASENFTRAYEADGYSGTVRLADSYAELSTNGKGVHIWVKDEIGKGRRSEGVEIYSQERFIICTGNAIKSIEYKAKGGDKAPMETLVIVPNVVKGIKPITDGNGWARRLADSFAHSSYDSGDLVEVKQDQEDAEIIRRAEKGNGEKFKLLYAGEWEKVLKNRPEVKDKSQSGQDHALISYLANYSKSNEQVRRMFKASGLWRGDVKWNKGYAYIDMSLKKIRDEQAAKAIKRKMLADSLSEKRNKYEESKMEDTTPQIDLLKHLPDSQFKRYVEDVAKVCWIPKNTSLLVGLGAFSGMASRVACVMYPDGKRIPLGEYIVCAHPPGTSKTRMLTFYQQPAFDVRDRLYAEFVKNNSEESDLTPPEDIYISNATPEALDKHLVETNGFFSLASSEQGMVDTIIGATYGAGNKNNDDLILNGYNAERSNTKRVTRVAFSGNPVGAITCFAQSNIIDTVLQKGNLNGFAERFLIMEEPDMLGERNHTLDLSIDPFAQVSYDNIAAKMAEQAITSTKGFRDLFAYTITPDSWRVINLFKNEMEGNIKQGAKYSSSTLRGMAAKADIHVIKIGTLLHILRGNERTTVDHICIEAAINIMRDMVGYTLGLMGDFGYTGKNANEESIINYLANSKGEKSRSAFRSNSKGNKVWKDLNAKERKKISDETFDDLIKNGIIEEYIPDGKSTAKRLRLLC